MKKERQMLEADPEGQGSLLQARPTIIIVVANMLTISTLGKGPVPNCGVGVLGVFLLRGIMGYYWGAQR